MGSSKTSIFLVDDDAVFLKLLEIEFKSHTEFKITTFPVLKQRANASAVTFGLAS